MRAPLALSTNNLCDTTNTVNSQYQIIIAFHRFVLLEQWEPAGISC
jgi:hypothetical protein